jgi:glycerate 2-kinase
MTGSDGLRVLIAPDSYGDSLTAVQAAEMIAVGWRRARPDDDLTLAPQSDGGPGFVGVLAGRLGELRTLRVSGPLTAEVDADWLYDPSGAGTAYIESAQACGLALLGGPPTAQTALAAHSRGVGQLIAAAAAAGAGRIVVGLGGSSCTDGGRGMVGSMGGMTAARGLLGGIDLIAATDVEHPLLGPTGAAHVFGPQKGADPETVAVLERRLTEWAAELDAAVGRAVSDDRGAGAAGGIGAALFALGGRRVAGAAVVAEQTRLADDVVAADVIVTGEGRLDDQSLRGKVVSALAALARAKRVVVLAGQVALDEATMRNAGISAAYAIAEHAGSVRLAIDDAADKLAGLAEVTAARLGNSGPTRYR